MPPQSETFFLVVSADASMRDTLGQVLTSLGAGPVSVVETLREGLLATAKGAVLVVLDCGAEIGAELGFVKTMRTDQDRGRIPVVLLFERRGVVDPRITRALQAGAHACLGKPLAADELKAVAVEVLNARASQQ